MIKRIPHTEVNSFDFNYRSEDVRFSPSGRRLALVATDGCLLLFSVDIDARPVRVEGQVEFRSRALLVPHGVEFLSEDVVVVANRNGNLVFFRIPDAADWTDKCVIEPIHEVMSPLFGRTGVTRKLRQRDLFCGPGSVRLVGDVLFVTCNYMNTVSTFGCRLDAEGLRVQEGVVVAHEGLSVVDGVAVSLDGHWMALSDHDHHRLAVFRRTGFGRGSEAEDRLRPSYVLACSLTDFDMHFPHGLRFSHDNNVLYAVDAGGRFIQVFETADQWQTDLRHSTLKTLGVDLDAFNKSRQDVPQAHQILEGGGKGLDIDPSGRVMVVTCRNQSLRFFELEEEVKLPVGDGSTAPIPANPNEAMAEFALSCLVDDTPEIWRSFIPWLATATRLANISPAHIHVHHVCDLSLPLARLCQDLGVKTHPVSRFDPRNVYSNKIAQGETHYGRVKSVLLTDVDVVFASPIPFQGLEGVVAGKPVDMENPPLAVLKNIFSLAGLGVVGICSSEFERNGIYRTFETVMGNFNGGLYIIPTTDLVRLSQRWGVWANWLMEHAGVMERWAKHSDQIAFCLAVNEAKAPLRILGNRWNFPTHLDVPSLGLAPVVLHHHAQLDDRYHMAPVFDPKANGAIKRVNEAISSFRRLHGL